MNNITPTELRKNNYYILDEVLDTGIPVQIIRNGKILKIISAEDTQKIDNLVLRPNVITGDPDDLPNVHWQDKIKLFKVTIDLFYLV